MTLTPAQLRELLDTGKVEVPILIVGHLQPPSWATEVIDDGCGVYWEGYKDDVRSEWPGNMPVCQRGRAQPSHVCKPHRVGDVVEFDGVDDMIEMWHTSGSDETRSLLEYLGWTQEQYSDFVEHGLPDVTVTAVEAKEVDGKWHWLVGLGREANTGGK